MATRPRILVARKHTIFRSEMKKNYTSKVDGKIALKKRVTYRNFCRTPTKPLAARTRRIIKIPKYRKKLSYQQMRKVEKNCGKVWHFKRLRRSAQCCQFAHAEGRLRHSCAENYKVLVYNSFAWHCVKCEGGQGTTR